MQRGTRVLSGVTAIYNSIVVRDTQHTHLLKLTELDT